MHTLRLCAREIVPTQSNFRPWTGDVARHGDEAMKQMRYALAATALPCKGKFPPSNALTGLATELGCKEGGN